jgi:serine/threonine-protein kinase
MGLGFPVVVKIAGQGRAAEQLRTEAATLSEIAHPNVVRLWDAGTHDEVPFLTTEYLARGSLKDEVARRGSLPAHEVLQMACDVVRGLRATLAVGFVHGDVKPGNLLLASNGTAKVADFGTSTRVNAEGIAVGDVVRGSWQYLAPERFGGIFDHRVDIYSLGLTIYYLLTGSPPVVASTPREALKAHRELTLEPLHWTVPQVSREASALFLKMAARDPDDRPANYDQLLADLTRLRDLPADSFDTDCEGYAT